MSPGHDRDATLRDTPRRWVIRGHLPEAAVRRARGVLRKLSKLRSLINTERGVERDACPCAISSDIT
jgi:hypothetical protein